MAVTRWRPQPTMGLAHGIPLAAFADRPAVVPIEEWRILQERHPNVLIQGPECDVRVVVDALTCHLLPARRSWHAGTPLVLPIPGEASLILHDVVELTDADQRKLLDWVKRPDRHPVQIVSAARTPLFQLAEERRFLMDLYYYLNAVCIDLSM